MSLRKASFLVFFITFLSFFLELLISRVFMFTMGNTGSFVAIPVALLGIAIGGFYCHFGGTFSERNLSRLVLAFILSALVGFAMVFLLSNTLLPITLSFKVLATKTLFFGTAFLLPFFLIGVITIILFRSCEKAFNQLYCSDFIGGSVACFCFPVLLHFLDLQAVLFIFFCLGLILYGAVSRKWLLAGLLAIGILILTATGVLFREKFDYSRTQNIGSLVQRNFIPKELQKKWNEFARVALIQYSKKGVPPFFSIVQDDSISNIAVVDVAETQNLIRTKTVKKEKLLYAEALPAVLGMKPEHVLVLMAGCGNEMVTLEALYGDKLKITGIEINPLVKQICEDSPFVKNFRLKEFYAKPNIDLVISEGRSYLQRHPELMFEVIYISREGSVHANIKQLFTAKYLMTTQAYSHFLQHLKPGGILVFGTYRGSVNPANANRIKTLKEVHNRSNPIPFRQCVFSTNDVLAYKPEGFTKQEIDTLSKNYVGKRTFYYHYLSSNAPGLRNQIENNTGTGWVLTDNNPFHIKWNSAVFSGKEEWFTMFVWSRASILLFLTVFTIVLVFLYGFKTTGAARLPLAATGYFFTTGFAYMCLQIGLINKFDLFMGNSIYSMALIMSLFLISNGAGSMSAPWLAPKIGMRRIVFLSILVTLGTVFIVQWLTREHLSLPLWQKIIATSIALFPIGSLLGVFFPFGISELQRTGQKAALPSAYGFSVLSSVLGATYSLTIVNNVGYDHVMNHAAVLYLILFFFCGRIFKVGQS